MQKKKYLSFTNSSFMAFFLIFMVFNSSASSIAAQLDEGKSVTDPESNLSYVGSVRRIDQKIFEYRGKFSALVWGEEKRQNSIKSAASFCQNSGGKFKIVSYEASMFDALLPQNMGIVRFECEGVINNNQPTNIDNADVSNESPNLENLKTEGWNWIEYKSYSKKEQAIAVARYLQIEFPQVAVIERNSDYVVSLGMIRKNQVTVVQNELSFDKNFSQISVVDGNNYKRVVFGKDPFDQQKFETLNFPKFIGEAGKKSYIQLSSHFSLTNALAVAKNHSPTNLPSLVFLGKNGWYITAVGPVNRADIAVRELKKSQSIPGDSFVTSGDAYIETIYNSQMAVDERVTANLSKGSALDISSVTFEGDQNWTFDEKSKYCNKALNINKTDWDIDALTYVNRVKAAGLTIENCRDILQTDAAKIQPKANDADTNVKNLNAVNSREICYRALNVFNDDWSQSSDNSVYLNEAKSRHLTVDDCRRELSLNPLTATKNIDVSNNSAGSSSTPSTTPIPTEPKSKQCFDMGFQVGTASFSECVLRLNEYEGRAKLQAQQYEAAKQQYEQERSERASMALMEFGLRLMGGGSSRQAPLPPPPIFAPLQPLIITTPNGTIHCRTNMNIVNCF